MGIFDRLRNFGVKHERTNVVRDDEGNVRYFQKDDLEPNRRRTSEMLEEYYEKHPTRYMRLKKAVGERIKEVRYNAAEDRKYWKETRQMERLARMEGLREGRVKRANVRGFERGFGFKPQQGGPVREIIHEKGKHGRTKTRISYAQPVRMEFDMMTGHYMPQSMHRQKQQDNSDLVFDMMTGRYVRRRR